MTTINYKSVERLLNVLFGKIMSFWLHLIENRMRRDNSKWTMFLWANESHIESDRTNDLLYNLNPEGLVFIPCGDFFNILIGYFAISLSSLQIKILSIRSTSEVIAGDPFWKAESPTRLVSWESSDQISRQSVIFIYPIDSCKEDIFA